MAAVLSGTTTLVGLLRHPLRDSLSPRMQNAAFEAAGLDWAYVALDVAPEDLEAALRGLVALGFAGANVTIPHKRAVAELSGLKGAALEAYARRWGYSQVVSATQAEVGRTRPPRSKQKGR